jgi:hypothetical protein
LPHALQAEVTDGPFSGPQWSGAAPSPVVGGGAGVQTPLAGTHTLTELPVVVVTAVQFSSAAHPAALAQTVPQKRSPANWPHVPLVQLLPAAHGAHWPAGGPASIALTGPPPPRSTSVPHATLARHAK